MKRIIATLLLLLSQQLYSQSFNIIDINSDNFPEIKAKFWAYDNNLNQIINLSPGDFEVLENGNEREVLDVTCPNPEPPQAISSVLTIDISGSMTGSYFDIARAGARAWIDNLPPGYYECAITTFNNINYFNQDFTTDKNKLNGALDLLFANNGTDFNAAFIDPNAGALLAAEKGKYKRIVILLSDGSGLCTKADIINKAKEIDASIYCIIINLSCPNELKDISEQTGGKWYDHIQDSTQIKEIYKEILYGALEREPCTLTYNSAITCNDSIADVDITLKSTGLNDTISYPAPISSLADLLFKPASVYFMNKYIGIKHDTTITVTAINADYHVTDIVSSNPAFHISPTDFSLKEGESIDLTLSFTPSDSNYTYAKFDIVNDICPDNYYAAGGYAGYKPKTKTLKLTHPNGAEVFVMGSDTIITWEGIPPGDKVMLEYSIDFGKTWNFITRNASGLEYKWENVPGPPSNECLVKVTQFGKANDNSLAPMIEWQKCLGGSRTECANSIIQTSDGNYVIAGMTSSNNGHVSKNNGATDMWVCKLDFFGNVLWERSFGGSNNDLAASVQETSDKGLIVAGYTSSENLDVAHLKGKTDFWVVKLDSEGNFKWEKTFGGSEIEYGTDIKQTDDHGFIVTGRTNSTDMDIMFPYGKFDHFVVKLDNNGYIQWSQTIGGDADEYNYSIIQTSDGGYLTTGFSDSYKYNNKSYLTNRNLWLIKLNINGAIDWVKSLGGTDHDSGTSLLETSDGSFMICGYTYSTDGDISDNRGAGDVWVIKADTSGKIIWEKTYGGSSDDLAYSIQATYDGGFIITGYSDSDDYDIESNRGAHDVLVLKIDEYGEPLWIKTYGGTNDDEGYSITQTLDGGYILAGYTISSDYDISGYMGYGDMWVAKLTPDGMPLQQDISDAVFSIVAPDISSRDIDMGKVVLGQSKDSLVKKFVSNKLTWPCSIDSIFVRGNDAVSFALIGGFPEYSIGAFGSHYGEFRFTPTWPGLFQAEIVIISQADTLVQNIYGEGVRPRVEIMEEIIDFGKVEVGEYKDTMQVMTIKNVGSAQLTINETKHNKPNDVDFTTQPGGGPFTLQPGDICKMNLRFEPAETGRTSGILEFHYDGTGSPAIVQLYGEGVNTAPKITADIDDFPVLICEYSSINYISITNTGGKNLIINDMQLSGADAAEFSINESLPITLMPKSSRNVYITFKPISTGDKNAILEISSNSEPDSLISIELNARKDSVAIGPEVEKIDLGIICPDEVKDTVISLINTGTLETGAYISLSDKLNSGSTSLKEAPGGSFGFNFTFSGQSEEGSINETITVTDSICSRQLEIPVTGIVLIPGIKADDITINSVFGAAGEAGLIIKNLSVRTITINDIPNISSPFEFTDNPFPLALEPGGSITLPLKYTPDDLISDSLVITLNAEPCSISEEINITGIPFTASITIKANDIEAYPGDIVNLPISLETEENISISGVTGLNFSLEFNPTLLLPSDQTAVRIDDSTAKITLNNLELIGKPGERLAYIPFKAGLGNARECPLTITDVSNNNGFAEIYTIPGTFKLLGVCTEGGIRLLNPDNRAGIINIYPNPAEDKIYLELSLTEESETEISIYNSMGRKVSTVFKAIPETGITTLEISTKELGTGAYLITLTTPTIVKSRSFSIVR